MKSINLLLMVIIMGLFNCKSTNYPPLDVVKYVDLDKYLGKWYEIALFPNSFEKGCNCTTAEYSILDENTVRVLNRCRKDSTKGEIEEAKGKAFIVPNSNNAKLKVQFFWPFKGDYWIIELDENYQYVVVGSPDREYLWILSRTPKLDKSIYDMLLEKIKAKGFDITKLKFTNQDCNF